MIENTKVDLSTTVNKEFPKHLKVELKSQDINNHMFELSFKDIELDSTYTIIVLSVFREAGTEIKSTATIQDGKAYYRFDTGFIIGDDTVANYVYVKQGAKTADVTSFTFKVSLSEIDEGSREVAKYYDFHYETLLESFERELNDYMTKLPEHVVINDETIDLTVYAKKSDLPDFNNFIEWSDMPELQEDKDTIYDDTELREKVEDKQDKLKAGNNIIINTIDNTISAIDTVPDLSPYATKAELPDTSQYLKLEDLPEIEAYDDTEIRQKLSDKQEKLEGGDNITIEGNTISATFPEIDLSSYALVTDIPDTSDYITLEDLPDVENYDDTELREEIATKQDELIAGENIIIDENNVISSTTSGGGEELEWIEMTLLNGWVSDSGDKPMYAKDSNGTVYFKGLISPREAVAKCFELPVGYAPKNRLTVQVTRMGSFTGLDIQVSSSTKIGSGYITAPSSTMGYVYNLVGISYSTL